MEEGIRDTVGTLRLDHPSSAPLRITFLCTSCVSRARIPLRSHCSNSTAGQNNALQAECWRRDVDEQLDQKLWRLELSRSIPLVRVFRNADNLCIPLHSGSESCRSSFARSNVHGLPLYHLCPHSMQPLGLPRQWHCHCFAQVVCILFTKSKWLAYQANTKLTTANALPLIEPKWLRDCR